MSHAWRSRLAQTARAALLAALGVVVCSAGTLLYFVAMPGQSHGEALPPPTPAEQGAARELERHVRALAVDIGERRALTGHSLERAEQYLQAELSAIAAGSGAKLRREAVPAPGAPGNWVLDVPGVQAGPTVLIGAHYDTAPEGTPGANDNGSGSAATLVLAARLAPKRHRLPLRFVLFVNEEMPYFQTPQMGAWVHARGCQERGEELRAMLSLETMGYYSDEPGSQKYPPPLDAFYPDRGNFIAFVGNVSSRALVRESIALFRRHATIPSEGGALPSGLPGVGWSDHWAFWQHGYAAVMVTDTALFRDPTYHRNSDVASNLDYARLGRVVVGLEQVIAALASG